MQTAGVAGVPSVFVVVLGDLQGGYGFRPVLARGDGAGDAGRPGYEDGPCSVVGGGHFEHVAVGCQSQSDRNLAELVRQVAQQLRPRATIGLLRLPEGRGVAQ